MQKNRLRRFKATVPHNMMTLVLLQNRLEHRVVLLMSHINVEKVMIYYVSGDEGGVAEAADGKKGAES